MNTCPFMKIYATKNNRKPFLLFRCTTAQLGVCPVFLMDMVQAMNSEWHDKNKSIDVCVCGQVEKGADCLANR